MKKDKIVEWQDYEPVKALDKKRTKTFTFKTTENTFNMIQDFAKIEKLSISDFLRKCIYKYCLAPKTRL